MSFTTNRLKQTQNKKDNGDSPCQQRKMVEYKTMNHLLTKYLNIKTSIYWQILSNSKDQYQNAAHLLIQN